VIETIDLIPYRLPLTRPWRSARGGLGERRGWLVRIGSGGLFGYGDCAPLPAAGTEETTGAWEWLDAWRGHTLRRPLSSALADPAGASAAKGLVWGAEPAPAARYAAECALADLAARRAEIPLALWLSPAPAHGVPVNAVLGALGDLAPADLTAAAAAGFRVLKVKVGLAPPGEELRRLAALAPHLPAGVALRLDANGAWTLAQAQRMTAGLLGLTELGLQVESLEEPLRDPGDADLRRLQAEVGFPLALDESLHHPGSAWDLTALPVRRLVVKPAVVGGLGRTLALADQARTAGLELVLTCLIESAAGLWPTVALAAALGSDIPQGLATAQWLARDLGVPPRPMDGWIGVPSDPGSGFCPWGDHPGQRHAQP
jgi:o-succinylbenzoate synthase